MSLALSEEEMVMTKRFTAYALAALACMAMCDASMAGELAPGSGYTVHLDHCYGVVYYSVEQDGYRVVVTLASGIDEQPIRFISTLGPGERFVISVPRAVNQPSVDLEILRNEEALLINDPVSSPTAALAQ
jgi:hypothetical protein